jgi:protein-disulfide isomerase
MDRKKKTVQPRVRHDMPETDTQEAYAPVEQPSYTDYRPQTQKPAYTPGPAHYIIVALLVASAYFLGNLSAKVQYLEKGTGGTGGGGGTTADAGAGNPPAAPAEQKVGEFPKVTDRDHMRGDKDAVVTLIEYSDYECPFCKSFHPTMQEVLEEYKGKVKWVYRHYPLSFHANAQKQAEAAECIYEQGGDEAFWKYTDLIYERTTAGGTGFALDKLGPLAAEVGVDQATFQTCLDSDKYAKHVKDDQDGGQRAGVQGTPGTIIMNSKTGKTKLIPGALPFTSVKPMIDEILES